MSEQQEDLMKKYIEYMLENQNNDDIIEETLLEGVDAMETKEFITVISSSDNPNLNLDVAQPYKYKFERKLGTGIVCYKYNALDILKKNLQKDEMIIKVSVKIDESKVLNLCSYGDKEYLRDIYETITDKSIIQSDTDFIDYVW